MRKLVSHFAIFFALTLFAPAVGLAQQNAPFFAGKQITLVVGSGAGGGNDLYARALAEFMATHIPGVPTLVVQDMPGSEGVNAASYIYNIAAKDGTIIGSSPASILLAEALNREQTHFDSSKFNWIGTIATTTDLLAVFKSTGAHSIEDAKKQEVIIGATGQFSLAAMEPAIANALLDTKFRIVKGYTGGGEELNVAMERREIEGRTNQWASWKVLRPAWIRNQELSYLLQFGPKEPDLPGSVPAIDELISTPEAKGIVDLLELPQYMGRSVFAPPGTPSDRVAILQRAFDDTMRDKGFVRRMEELNLDLSPHEANIIQKLLERSAAGRNETVKNMKRLLKLE